jgi:hypothetical protein
VVPAYGQQQTSRASSLTIRHPIIPWSREHNRQPFFREISSLMDFQQLRTPLRNYRDVKECLPNSRKLGPWESIAVGIRQIGANPTPAPSDRWAKPSKGPVLWLTTPLALLEALGSLESLYVWLGATKESLCPIPRSPRRSDSLPLIFAIREKIL